MVETVVTKLVEQLPSAAAIIVVVVYFIRYIQRRDEADAIKTKSYLDILSNLMVSMGALVNKQDAHHSAFLDAVSDMRNVTRQRTRDTGFQNRGKNPPHTEE